MKKKNGVLPLGDFYTMGLNSSLSSPNSELRAGLEKGGGGSQVDSDGSTPVNRMMIFDHSLGLIDLKVCPGLKRGNVIISEHEFNIVFVSP